MTFTIITTWEHVLDKWQVIDSYIIIDQKIKALYSGVQTFKTTLKIWDLFYFN